MSGQIADYKLSEVAAMIAGEGWMITERVTLAVDRVWASATST